MFFLLLVKGIKTVIPLFLNKQHNPASSKLKWGKWALVYQSYPFFSLKWGNLLYQLYLFFSYTNYNTHTPPPPRLSGESLPPHLSVRYKKTRGVMALLLKVKRSDVLTGTLYIYRHTRTISFVLFPGSLVQLELPRGRYENADGESCFQ